MSALSYCVTCGIVLQAWLRCSAVFRRMLLIGWRSTSPHFGKSGSGRAAPCPPAPRVVPTPADDAPRVFLDVLLGDAAAGAGARHLVDVDAELARQPAHGRRRGRGRPSLGTRSADWTGLWRLGRARRHRLRTPRSRHRDHFLVGLWRRGAFRPWRAGASADCLPATFGNRGAPLAAASGCGVTGCRLRRRRRRSHRRTGSCRRPSPCRPA